MRSFSLVQNGLRELMEKRIKSECGPGMRKRAVIVFNKVLSSVADLRELSQINMSRSEMRTVQNVTISTRSVVQATYIQ